MATFTDDENQIRKEFAHLKAIFEKLRIEHFSENPDFNDFAKAAGRGLCRKDIRKSPDWCRFNKKESNKTREAGIALENYLLYEVSVYKYLLLQAKQALDYCKISACEPAKGVAEVAIKIIGD